MATVGIMSMQRIANYGSFLQAYALKTMIEELGHSVQFVDYRVCSPVIQDVTESSNKLTRMVKKGLETFAFQAPLQHKLAFIKFKKTMLASISHFWVSLTTVTIPQNWTAW